MNRPEELDRLWSIHVSQAVVDDDDVWPLLLSHFDTLFGSERCADNSDLRIITEQAHHALEDHLVVVDDDDADHRLITHGDRARHVHPQAGSLGRKASPAARSLFREHLLPAELVERDRT